MFSFFTGRNHYKRLYEKLFNRISETYPDLKSIYDLTGWFNDLKRMTAVTRDDFSGKEMKVAMLLKVVDASRGPQLYFVDSIEVTTGDPCQPIMHFDKEIPSLYKGDLILAIATAKPIYMYKLDYRYTDPFGRTPFCFVLDPEDIYFIRDEQIMFTNEKRI